MTFALADRFVTLIRRDSYLLQATTAAATLTPAFNDVDRESYAKVTVQGGTDNTGTVTVWGTVAGATGSEALSFTAASAKRTDRPFSRFASFATTGLTNEATVPTVTVQAVGSDASPQHTERTVAENLPCTVSYGVQGGDYKVDRQGSERDRFMLAQIPWIENMDAPKEGDLLREDLTGDVWFVHRVDLPRSRHRPSHWELRCSRYENR